MHCDILTNLRRRETRFAGFSSTRWIRLGKWLALDLSNDNIRVAMGMSAVSLVQDYRLHSRLSKLELVTMACKAEEDAGKNAQESLAYYEEKESVDGNFETAGH
jgi:hypothetical protein